MRLWVRGVLLLLWVGLGVRLLAVVPRLISAGEKTPTDQGEADLTYGSLKHKTEELTFSYAVLPHPGLGRSNLWYPPVVPTSVLNAAALDHQLVDHLQRFWICGPSPSSSGYQARHQKYRHPLPKADPDAARMNTDLGLQVQTLLPGTRTRTFLEYGVRDQPKSSARYLAEKYVSWSGVFVEPDPMYFSELMNHRHRTLLLNACISPQERPTLLPLTNDSASEKLSDETIQALSICFPLVSILEASGITKLDYLSINLADSLEDILTAVRNAGIPVSVISVQYQRSAELRKINRLFHKVGTGYEQQETTVEKSVLYKFIS